MTAYWLLVFHGLGDYILQSDWMANEKAKRWWPAIAHAVIYTIPFALLMPRWEPLLLIGGSHLIIDRFRLARYLCWAKNLMAPRRTVEHIPDPEGNWHKAPTDTKCVDWKTGAYVCGHPTFRREETFWRHPWSECQPTGYHKSKPMWLTLWLMFIADNVLHLACNGLAWHLWG